MGDNLSKKFAVNLSYALIAQLLSFVASIVLSLIVPKLLGVEQFAYWQLFIFYSGYTGLFHFGLSDGIYLRYGGQKYEKLNHGLLGSQLRIMMIFHIILGIVASSILLITVGDSSRVYIWIATIIYLIIGNIFWYLGFVFQAINETRIYSIGTIITKVLFIISIGLIILLKTSSFKPFVVLYIVAMAVAMIYECFHAPDIIFGKQQPLKITLKEVFVNCKIGINLTISSIASTLILGVARLFVDAKLGLETFGMISLALSLTSFFLQFISQVSLVLFPMLRQLKSERTLNLFTSLRYLPELGIIVAFVLFLPIKFLLRLWLPNYADSFSYLGILLPLCIFDGRMQLVYNTYFKVLRKEKMLLMINLISLALSAALSFISVYFIGSIIAVAISMVAVVCIRSIIADLALSKELCIHFDKGIYGEILLSAFFIIINLVFDTRIAFILIIVGVIFFAIFNYSKIKNILRSLKSVVK